MQTPKISVIIPSLNKVDYIEETLKSIFRQKYKNFEVIIKDGGSTDGSLEIIKKYAKKYPENIIWTSNKDKGQMDAINKGFGIAKGDLLAFINADDVYDVNAFENIVIAFNKNPKNIWYAGWGKIINDSGDEVAKIVTIYKRLLLKINSYLLLEIVNYFVQPSVFISKKCFNDLGPFSGSRQFVMEYQMWLSLGKFSMPTIVDSCISSFRLVSEGKTKKMFKNILKRDQEILKKYTNNRFIIFLHEVNNRMRILMNKLI